MVCEKVDRCAPEHNEVFGHRNCLCVVIGGRSFVLNRKNEVLCFVGVAKLALKENRSFVSNRNWCFRRRRVQKKAAEIPPRDSQAGPACIKVPCLPSQKSLWAGRMTMLVASRVAQRALNRPAVLFDIFTDSSSPCGAQNAKRCVCTSPVFREGHCS
jgi:hypothetical protein